MIDAGEDLGVIRLELLGPPQAGRIFAGAVTAVDLVVTDDGIVALEDRRVVGQSLAELAELRGALHLPRVQADLGHRRKQQCDEDEDLHGSGLGGRPGAQKHAHEGAGQCHQSRCPC